MPTKYVARLNNEIVAKRTTKDRTYTHCVYVTSPTREGWSQANWCGRLDLARKSAASWMLNCNYVAQILPAEQI